MDAEEFRKWGKKMVDFAADYLETIEKRRVLSNVEPGEYNFNPMLQLYNLYNWIQSNKITIIVRVLYFCTSDFGT